MSLPEWWKFSVRGLAEISKEGKGGITGALQELERCGYLVRKQTHRADGKMGSIEYWIYETPQEPCPDSPCPGNPDADNPEAVSPEPEQPEADNAPQIITNRTRTKESKHEKNREPRHRYGQYGNVLFTDDELAKLQAELSYLKPEEQRDFLSAMDYAQAAPSVSQTQRIKKKSQEGACSLDDMCAIMDEVKKDDLGKVSFKTSDLQKFFPKSFTPQQMSNTILRLLEQWQRRRERDQTVARPGQPPEVMKETESWEEVESQGCFDCLEVVSDNALDIDRLMMVFDGRRVLYLGQERYLLGPVVIYKCDEEGDSVSLSAEDVIAAVVYFVNHTVTLCGDGKDFKAFRI